MNLEGRTVAILATGPSMSLALARTIKAPAIVVNDAFNLKPDADALVAQDAAWWNAHPAALDFAGEKIGGPRVEIRDVTRVNAEGPIGTGTNSGALALFVAMKAGAKRVLLYGYDMHGTHYFGPHPYPLKNTTEARFAVFHHQFARLAAMASRQGVEVINCTKGSHLTCFPMMGERCIAA